MIHELEPRVLLAATLSGGVLSITGTANGDFVELVRLKNDPNTVQVTVRPAGGSPEVKPFRYADISLINISTVGGDDLVLVKGRSDDAALQDFEQPIGVNAGTGDDTIRTTGTRGACHLTGGDGNDTFEAGSGADRLEGGPGESDTADYSARTGALTVDPDGVADDGERDGAEGDNVTGVEVLLGGSGNDRLTGGESNDRLNGGAGDDTLSGGPGDDRLEGDFGTDTLVGGVGSDRFDGGDAFDTADYAARADNLVLVIEDDPSLTRGRSGAAAGGEGDLILDTVEFLTGGSGNDHITGDAHLNVLRGGPGDDRLFGMADGDRLFGGDGRDTLNGGTGNDSLDGEFSREEMRALPGGGDGRTFVGDKQDDVLIGGDDFDTASYVTRTVRIVADLDGVNDDGEAGEQDRAGIDIERIVGGSAADQLTANAGADSELEGRGGDDVLNGAARDDRLEGGDGNDTLSGAAGDDTLQGGSGADTLRGGSHNPNRPADPTDPIGGDTADYSDHAEGVRVDIDGAADDGNASDASGSRRDNVSSDVENVTGGRGSDVITGSNLVTGSDGKKIFNLLEGGPGNDLLTGGGGDDLLDGGAGADKLVGGSGADTAFYFRRQLGVMVDLDGDDDDGEPGEADNVMSDVEGVSGGSGDDVITGNGAGNFLDGGPGRDVIRGGGGNDKLTGGDGDDLLDGGEGADNFVGGLGDDTVDYSGRSTPVTVDLDGVADDGRSTGEGDNVGRDIENVTGGTGADRLTGGAGPNVLKGNGGNDVLSGGDGDDRLDGGRGADRLIGGNGLDTADYSDRGSAVALSLDGVANDGEPGEADNVNANTDSAARNDVEVLVGGAARDVLTGNDADNVIDGGAGDDEIDARGGNDRLNGGEGNDKLDGGLGADSIEGGAGTDAVTYVGRTTGISVDLDGVADDGALGEGDNVAADVDDLIGGNGDDRLTGGPGPNRLVGNAGADRLDGGPGDDVLEGDDPAGVGVRTDVLIGGDGTDTVDYSWRTRALLVTLNDPTSGDGEVGENENLGRDIENVNGGAGNDSIVARDADAVANRLAGGAGNDVLKGGGGNDLIDGGAGRDDLSGGPLGSDSAFYFHRTEALNVSLDGVANDGAPGENDFVRNDFEGISGGEGNDTLTGNAGKNTLDGGGGDDLLVGLGGDDRLTGKFGADRFVGGPDFDEVNYDDGFHDAGVVADVGGGADDGLPNERDDVGTEIEKVIGGKGADRLTGNAAANNLAGGPGDDVLVGLDGNDTLSGGDGDDVMDGGAGADVLNGGAGSRDLVDYSARSAAVNVSLDKVANDGDPAANNGAGERDNAGADGDVEGIIGGSGNDRLAGDARRNFLIDGGAGDDILGGKAGDDVLAGGPGEDQLFGDEGNDVLRGGAETDRLVGGGDGSPDPITSRKGDTADYSDHAATVTVDLDGVADDGADGENDAVGNDVEHVTGGDGNDRITGSNIANVVNFLEGGRGDDKLFGLAGVDVLDGGLGRDELSGGSGLDSAFYFFRTEPVKVTLDGLANDGEGGGAEGDNALADVEAASGGQADDVLIGNDSFNNLDGGPGDDRIEAGAGDDKLTGGAGDDVLVGGTGRDNFIGGAGSDAVDYSASPFGVNVTLGSTAGGGVPGEADAVGADIEGVIGTSFRDNLVGNGERNILVGGAGDDFLDGRGGDDLIAGGPGRDVMRGDTGDDLFSNRDGPRDASDTDDIDGGDGVDSYQGDRRFDTVARVEFDYDPDPDALVAGGPAHAAAEAGGAQALASALSAPTLSGGRLTVIGTEGADTITLSLSSDSITASLVTPEGRLSRSFRAADVREISVDARDGADSVNMGNVMRTSRLRGGKGNDTLVGGPGNDLFLCGDVIDGNDVMRGGGGVSDAVDYSLRGGALNVHLGDGRAEDGEVGGGERDDVGADVEIVYGGRGSDTLTGGSRGDFFNGGAGADVIAGNGGIDVLVGSTGADFVLGGTGVDYMILTDGSVDRYRTRLGGANDFAQVDVFNDSAAGLQTLPDLLDDEPG